MNTPFIASEDDFLSLIGKAFPNVHETVLLGRGDDCAEIACPSRMVVSTDLFVEDVHFRQAYFTPFEIGYKALAVNISDIASAGAKPLGVSVGLVVPTPFPRSAAQGLVEGMAFAARAHTVALTGGDLSRGEKLALCVTIWGGPEGNDPFLRRGPVAPGDVLFACGRLGLARAGLAALEAEGRAALDAWPEACKAHLTPVPLVNAGRKLASAPGCRLMDVSDGLARDLPRMLRAYDVDYGAEISLPEAALHPEATAFARNARQDPAVFAFSGGEDYALLGACSEEAFALAARALTEDDDPPLLRLGRVVETSGIVLNGALLSNAGFDHFSG